MSFDAFISYSSKDRAAAQASCNALESNGIRCWMAPRDIRAGLEYAAGIIEGIDTCRVMVLIFSANANVSQQIHREIERALSKGLTIIPFRIEDTSPTGPMEYYLGPIHWLDAITPPLAAHLGELVEQVNGNLSLDPRPPTTPAISLAKPPRKRESASSKTLQRPLIAGLIAIVLFAVASLALLRGPVWFEILFPKQATPEQAILLNLLRASYGEPLSSGIPTAPIGLQELGNAFRIGYPAELLFWLFTDTFEEATPRGKLGYHYNPPDDLGCAFIDPKHRCFIDWVHSATLDGLFVEERSQLTIPGSTDQGTASAITSPAIIRYERFCFDIVKAEQARALVPKAIIDVSAMDTDLPPELLYGGTLSCGSPDWRPESAAGAPQPNTLPMIFSNGRISFKIDPRSPYGLFAFLGNLVGLQRAGYAPTTSQYPPERPWVADIPPRLATVHGESLITVIRGGSGCFVAARYKGIDYCVPENAAITKDVFGILAQLIPPAARQ